MNKLNKWYFNVLVFLLVAFIPTQAVLVYITLSGILTSSIVSLLYIVLISSNFLIMCFLAWGIYQLLKTRKIPKIGSPKEMTRPQTIKKL